MLDRFYPIVRAVRPQTALEHIILTSPADSMPPVLRALYPLSHRPTRTPGPQPTHQEWHEDHTLHAMHTLLESPTGVDREVFSPKEQVLELLQSNMSLAGIDLRCDGSVKVQSTFVLSL